MVAIRGMKAANWADEPSQVENAAGFPLFHKVELVWKRPTLWPKAQRLPKFNSSEPFIYALIRDHGKAVDRDRIEYIGLTTSPATRFGNHKTARRIVNKRGRVMFSYAPITFVRGRNRIRRLQLAIEEIEHLLIWAIPDHLENDKKQFTLPGMGINGGEAWHIINRGYRFRGRMPAEIVFPWMLLRPGRNRTAR